MIFFSYFESLPDLVTPSTVRTALTKVRSRILAEPSFFHPVIFQALFDFLSTMFHIFTSQGKHDFYIIAELDNYIVRTRSVFANDKFVKLMQDVTRQRKIFEK